MDMFSLGLDSDHILSCRYVYFMVRERTHFFCVEFSVGLDSEAFLLLGSIWLSVGLEGEDIPRLEIRCISMRLHYPQSSPSSPPNDYTIELPAACGVLTVRIVIVK